MSTVLHGDLRPGAASGIHAAHAYEVADAAALAALSVTSLDVGKFALRLDTRRLYLLRSVAPATWVPISELLASMVADDSSIAAANLAAALSGLSAGVASKADAAATSSALAAKADSAATTASLAAKADLTLPPTTYSASITLGLGDVNRMLRFTGATAQVLTIPTNAAVAIPVGSVVPFVRLGAGELTITPASGVTLNPTGLASYKARAAGSLMSLYKAAADEWDLAGDLYL